MLLKDDAPNKKRFVGTHITVTTVNSAWGTEHRKKGVLLPLPETDGHAHETLGVSFETPGRRARAVLYSARWG